MDTITESPKKTAKDKENAENKENSVLMKQRSTKRWRLFGGSKPKHRSVDKGSKSDSNEDLTGKKHDGKKLKKVVETQERKGASENRAKTDTVPENQAEHGALSNQTKTGVLGNRSDKGSSQASESQKNGLVKSVSKEATTHSDRAGQTGMTPITETFTKSTLRQLNSQESSPKPLRDSLKKPSELRATQNTGYIRPISSGAATLPRAKDSQVKRTNSDIKTTERVFTSLRRAREEKNAEFKTERDQSEAAVGADEETGVEKEKKRVKLDAKSRKESVFDDIKR